MYLQFATLRKLFDMIFISPPRLIPLAQLVGVRCFHAYAFLRRDLLYWGIVKQGVFGCLLLLNGKGQREGEKGIGASQLSKIFKNGMVPAIDLRQIGCDLFKYFS